MKKIIYLFIVLFFTLSVSFAQSLVLLDKQGKSHSLGTLKVVGTFTDGELVEELMVKNTTDKDLLVYCTQEIVQNVRGSSSAFCWSSCFSNPQSPFTSSPISINAGSTDSSSFSSHYDAMNNSGTVLFKYMFYADSTSDTTTVFIQFDVSSTAAVQKLSNRELKIYPNPTNHTIYLPQELQNKRILIYDVKSALVKKVVKNSSNKLDISDLHKGVYFIQIKTEDALYHQKFIKK